MIKNKFGYINWLIIGLVIIILSGCSFHSIKNNPENKIDFALKQKLEDVTDENLKILGKYKGVSKDEIRQLITDLGGSVGTTTNSIFTVECSKKIVYKILELDEVDYLELSKQVNLKNK